MSVTIGLDILLRDNALITKLASQKIGILAHAASITGQGEHIWFALKRLGIAPVRIFSPEHGLWGAAQDMEGVEHCHDAIIEREIISLYGNKISTLRPDDSLLDSLDAIIIDIQDVGARYYTFAYTALFLTQAALKRGLDVYIADRPNPINASTVEGNLIDPAFRSFVGERTGMIRHGMTIGEEITMWCAQDKTPNTAQNLHVIWMDGYSRQMYYDDTGCLWAMPSPNMPTLDTAIVYPGMCLIEGTNVSEGRGTTRPFELFGAPWLNPRETLDVLQMFSLPGVFFRPLDFKPMFQKHAGTICHGFQIHVTNRHIFRPVMTGIAILCVLKALHPEFAWRTETYEFVSDRLAIDLLFGGDLIRKQIESQANPLSIIKNFPQETAQWQTMRKDFLHY